MGCKRRTLAICQQRYKSLAHPGAYQADHLSANGERTFQFPHANYGGPPAPGYGAGYNQGYNSGDRQGYNQGYNSGDAQGYAAGMAAGERLQAQQDAARAPKHSGMAYGAMGAAGGLVAGMLLEHEGEKVHHKFEEAEYGARRDWDGLENRVHRDEWEVREDIDQAKWRAENDIRRDEYRVEDGIQREEWRAENDIRRDEYRAEDDVRRAEDDVRRDEWRAEERVDDFRDDARYDVDRIEDRVCLRRKLAYAQKTFR